MSLQNSDSTTRKKISINHLKNMNYMEMIEHYIEYPAKGLKFTFTDVDIENVSAAVSASQLGKNVPLKVSSTKKAKAKFLSEKEKAEGWREVFSESRRNFKFLQTNLHYLPEHLWSKMKPFQQEGTTVGFKVRDKGIHFFVHNADTDNESRELFSLVTTPYSDVVRIQELLTVFDDKGIESWLTIRAKSLLE